MRRFRPLLLWGLMLAVGGTLGATAQEGTSVLANPGQQASSTPVKSKANHSHRKHWWSPPHWFHRKHKNAANAKGAAPDSKAAVSKNQPVANPAGKTVVATKPVPNTVAATPATKPATGAQARVVHARTARKSTRRASARRRRRPARASTTPRTTPRTSAAHPRTAGLKSVHSAYTAQRGNGMVAAAQRRRQVLARKAAAGKTSRSNCTAAQAKPGGCQVNKGSAPKAPAPSTPGAN